MAIRLHGQIIANRDDAKLAMGNGPGKNQPLASFRHAEGFLAA
jgi:hypothetical protein